MIEKIFLTGLGTVVTVSLGLLALWFISKGYILLFCLAFVYLVIFNAKLLGCIFKPEDNK